MRVLSYCTTVDFYQEVLIDYVSAPFKERGWSNTDVPTDSDYSVNNWDNCLVNDDIDDTSEWVLCVPYLDALSAELSNSFDDTSSMVLDDNAFSSFVLYGVDSKNGSIYELFSVELGYYKVGLSKWHFARVYVGGVLEVEKQLNLAVIPIIEFSCSILESRSVMSSKVRLYSDYGDLDVFNDYSFRLDIDDIVDNPSSEFVASTYYDVDFDSNIEFTSYLTDFDLVSRDIFTDIGNVVDDVLGIGGDILGGGVDIFTALFRWLGKLLSDTFSVVGELIVSAFGIIGDAITAAIDTMASALESAIDLVTSAIDTMSSALESGIDFVTSAIDDMVTALSE